MNQALNEIFDQLPGYIGWKDINFRHLGCNRNLADILQLKTSNKIIGLKDDDLIDQTEESCLFHRKNDQFVLKGKTISGIHQSSSPYDGSLFYFVKKPLFNSVKKITGLIYSCQEFTQSKLLKNLITSDKKNFPKDLISSHYQIEATNNPYKLSEREMECLFFILRGKNAKQIGEMLNLSKRTVEFYIENIKNKFGCSTKSDIMLLAIANDYLSVIPARFLKM